MNNATKEITSWIQVKKVDNYQLTVATKAVKKDSIVCDVTGNTMDSPDRYSIQTNRDQHTAAPAIKYINHSCDPNLYFDSASCTFKARFDIEQDEEITFNYNTTELSMACPFTCHCGADHCFQEIKGYEHLSIEQKAAVSPLLADHLKLDI